MSKLFLKLILIFGVIATPLALGRQTGQMGRSQKKVKKESLERNFLYEAEYGLYPNLFRQLLKRADIKLINVNKIYIRGGKGLSVLHLVSRRFDGEPYIRALLKHPKINVNIRDTAGATPLHTAVWSIDRGKNFEELLKDSRVNVNIQDNDGATPLHVASSKCFVRAVEKLLAHPKINVNVVNRQYVTPLDSVRCRNPHTAHNIQQKIIKAGGFSGTKFLNKQKNQQ